MSSVAARLKSSIIGSIVSLLITVMVTLQQPGPSSYITKSEQHILLLQQVLRHYFLIRESTLLHALEGPRLRAP
jgi:hypothetical protein